MNYNDKTYNSYYYNRITGVVLRCRSVHKGELEADGGIEIIQEVTPAVKDGTFVFILRKLVVDVLELNGSAVIMGFDPAGAVRKHPLKRNAFLRGHVLSVTALCPGDGGLHLLLLLSGEFLCL